MILKNNFYKRDIRRETSIIKACATSLNGNITIKLTMPKTLNNFWWKVEVLDCYSSFIFCCYKEAIIPLEDLFGKCIRNWMIWKKGGMMRKGLFCSKGKGALEYFASIRWNAEVLICPLVLNFECLKLTSRSQSNFGEA